MPAPVVVSVPVPVSLHEIAPISITAAAMASVVVIPASSSSAVSAVAGPAAASVAAASVAAASVAASRPQTVSFRSSSVYVCPPPARALSIAGWGARGADHLLPLKTLGRPAAFGVAPYSTVVARSLPWCSVRAGLLGSERASRNFPRPAQWESLPRGPAASFQMQTASFSHRQAAWSSPVRSSPTARKDATVGFALPASRPAPFFAAQAPLCARSKSHRKRLPGALGALRCGLAGNVPRRSAAIVLVCAALQAIEPKPSMAEGLLGKMMQCMMQN